MLPLLLNGAKLRKFKQEFLPALRDLKLWCVNIQARHYNLAQCRALFEAATNTERLKGKSQEYEDRLKPDHSLVKCPAFENGVVKIIQCKSEEMTVAEQVACACLLKNKWPHLYPKDAPVLSNDNSDNEDYNSPTKFMARLKAGDKRPREEDFLQSNYISNLNWITPTTCEVERLFSKCKNVMTASRRRMTPRIFEAIVFLKENHEWWNINLVQDMVNKLWKEKLEAEFTDVDYGMQDYGRDDDGIDY